MIERLKGAYRKLPPIGKYLLFSVLVTLVDAALSWLLSMRLEVRLPVANTIGVVVGQVIHYALSSGQVFDMEYGGVGAVIYFSTFLLGLVAANAIITAVFALAVALVPKDLALLAAKGCSIVVPFFGLYFLRKFLYYLVKRRRSR